MHPLGIHRVSGEGGGVFSAMNAMRPPNGLQLYLGNICRMVHVELVPRELDFDPTSMVQLLGYATERDCGRRLASCDLRIFGIAHFKHPRTR